MLIAIALCVVGCVGAMVWALMPSASSRRIRQRLQSEGLAIEVSSQSPVMSRVSRALAPLHRLPPVQGYLVGVSQKLDTAGLHFPAVRFLIFQEGALALAIGGYLYLANSGVVQFNTGFLVMVTLLGVGLPMFWLNNAIQERRATIARDLPELVDLLNLCVGAGADFMSAMGRIVREFRPCPARDELAIVLSEVRVGKRRRDALRAFAERIRTAEASTFARTLIQADRMGTGLIDALAVLSEDMRLQRYHWAERFAQQAPMKMLLPLLLSMGSALVIVAAPILVQFLRGGFFNPNMDLMKPS